MLNPEQLNVCSEGGSCFQQHVQWHWGGVGGCDLCWGNGWGGGDQTWSEALQQLQGEALAKPPGLRNLRALCSVRSSLQVRVGFYSCFGAFIGICLRYTTRICSENPNTAAWYAHRQDLSY